MANDQRQHPVTGRAKLGISAGIATGGTAIAATVPAGVVTGAIGGLVGALLDGKTERDCLGQPLED